MDPETARPRIKTFILVGLTVTNDEKADDTDYIELRYNIDNFILKNVQVFRSGEAKTSGTLLKLCNEATIQNLIIEDVFADKITTLVKGAEGQKVDLLKLDNVVLKNGKALVDAGGAAIGTILENNVTLL